MKKIIKKGVYIFGWLSLAFVIVITSIWFYAEIIRGGEAWIAVEITYLDNFYFYYHRTGITGKIFDLGYDACLADQKWIEQGKKDLKKK